MLLYELFEAKKKPVSKAIKKKLKVKRKRNRKHVQEPEYPKTTKKKPKK